ncbi:hypothetical protein ABIA39_009074 [Nocardia sp. GAS34]
MGAGNEYAAGGFAAATDLGRRLREIRPGADSPSR